MKYTSILIAAILFIAGCGNKEEVKLNESYTFASIQKNESFNADSAYKFIEEQISFGPRNPNSIGQVECLDYLSSKLNAFLPNISIDSFHYNGYDGERLKLFNIVGQFNPNASNKILLAAHWDTRPRAERALSNKDKPIIGANDGASGAAVLLEIARNLKKMNLDFGVDIVLFDGEDYGREDDLDNFCLGSKYFAAVNKTKYQFAVVLDMIGDKNAEFEKEYNSYNTAQREVEMIWGIARNIGADKFNLSDPRHNVYDDHIPLIQAGIKALDIIDAGLIGGKDAGRDYWHTHRDDMRNISRESLKQVGSVMLTLLGSINFNGEK